MDMTCPAALDLHYRSSLNTRGPLPCSCLYTDTVHIDVRQLWLYLDFREYRKISSHTRISSFDCNCFILHIIRVLLMLSNLCGNRRKGKAYRYPITFVYIIVL